MSHKELYIPSATRSYKSGYSSDSRATTAKQLETSRRDTDHFLQYYQSPLADGVKSDDSDGEAARSPRLRREMSGGSTSPSDYSSDDREGKKLGNVDSGVRRRPSLPSDGSSDRRRLAIVQMETVAEATSNTSAGKPQEDGTLRSRRGLASNLAGLALVAPPDAAVKSYTQLTPPSTAPITGETYTRDAPHSSSHSERGHNRSASEVVNSVKRSPRDVGIVGTGRASPMVDPPNENHAGKDKNNALQPPIFQQPVSRSPSPASVASDHARHLLSPARARTPMTSLSTEQLIVTPEIGEEKHISTRVAGPVVVSLESTKAPQPRKNLARAESPTPQVVVQQVPTTAFPATGTSSYLSYQPGVHATAGPLPPPPRAMFNIDTNSPAPPRPPRLNSPNPARPRGDIEAVRQALQLPASVSAALASRSPKPTPVKTLNTSKVDALSNSNSEVDETTLASSSELGRIKSVHRREGAFSPSTITTASDSDATISLKTPSSTEAHENFKANPIIVDDTPPPAPEVINYDDGPPITIIKPLKPIAEKQTNESVTENADVDDYFLVPTTPERRTSDELPNGSRSLSPPPPSHTGETPSPPPKSFRNSLTNGLKRFSTLPRTPSTKSSRRSSGGTLYSSRTPSPAVIEAPLPAPRQKIKSQYPSAMYCSEVFSRKTALERCAVYAHKINELYMYDCGLEDWIIETKYRANANRPTFSSTSHAFTPQPRHTSRASMISEVTFPRRLDASTATDLSVKTRDLVPTSPPPLPYPSLAQSQRAFPTRTSSVASGTPPSSIRSLAPSTPVGKTGGFFSSLGRKASLTSARGAKPGNSPVGSPGGGRLLTKNPPSAQNTPSPRVINISTNPSVPGGPRAPPHRALRSQTIMTTTNPFMSSSPTSDRGDGLARRPSLSNISQERIIDIQADPEFIRQVDKLAELLPHADRGVLAGYLRRSGQSILAIGQYLEDEKNGTIKY